MYFVKRLCFYFQIDHRRNLPYFTVDQVLKKCSHVSTNEFIDVNKCSSDFSLKNTKPGFPLPLNSITLNKYCLRLHWCICIYVFVSLTDSQGAVNEICMDGGALTRVFCALKTNYWKCFQHWLGRRNHILCLTESVCLYLK